MENSISILSFEELREIAKGTNRAEMHKAFGIHFAANLTAKELEKKANTYISSMSVYLQNWKTLLEGIQPELVEQHTAEIEKFAESAKTLNEVQRKKLAEMLLGAA